jgi:hypothetical protein
VTPIYFSTCENVKQSTGLGCCSGAPEETIKDAVVMECHGMGGFAAGGAAAAVFVQLLHIACKNPDLDLPSQGPSSPRSRLTHTHTLSHSTDHLKMSFR